MNIFSNFFKPEENGQNNQAQKRQLTPYEQEMLKRAQKNEPGEPQESHKDNQQNTPSSAFDITAGANLQQKTAPSADGNGASIMRSQPPSQARSSTAGEAAQAGASRGVKFNLGRNIASIFTHAKLDDEVLQEFEDLLLASDFGLETTDLIIAKIKELRYQKGLSGQEVKLILRDIIVELISPNIRPFQPDFTKKPFVILFVGVNGTGKTTSIAKLASQFVAQGKSVMFAAGDTFRAAASEQLNIWAERLGAEIFSSKTGNDPASIVFEAYKQAIAKQTDILFIDTAGRLQNKTELMDELAKIIRVLQKINPTAPHAVLQTIDANTGQNALKQVEQFKAIAGVTGLILTKLDGTAKGGIMLAVSQKFNLPIHYVGLGEGVNDLKFFSAVDYANSICELNQ